MTKILSIVFYLIVNVVYYLIPAIITWLLAVLLGNGILTVIVSFIITVVFALANYMAICKLAQSEDLFAALSVGDAISDISRVGVLKIFLWYANSLLYTFPIIFW